MKIKFNGAAKTVTGSQTLLQHENRFILVDCGLYQGPKPMRLKNWEKPDHLASVEAIVLTHAHIDHSGLIPRWVKLGWRGRIICTAATADLLQILLLDAAKLQEEDARFANKTKYSHHDPALALYTEVDAHLALGLVEVVPAGEWEKVSDVFQVRFLTTGHILGSSIVQVNYVPKDNSGLETKTITFSGDLSGGHSEILQEPNYVLESNHVVVESTYGDRVIPIAEREQSLAEVVSRVFKRRGTLIIPAFALGRSQDILFSLWKLRNQKKIPHIPIYLDSPMANAVTRVYLKYRNQLLSDSISESIIESLSSPFFEPVESADESMLLCMSSQPKIVISASGMLQGGRVLRHLRTRLSDTKSAVLFVGFQAEGTKGRLLQEGLKNLRIYHEEIDVFAEIITIAGFSAHADQNELLKWVSSFSTPIEKIFINHGEEDSGNHLRSLLQNHMNSRIIQPSLGSEYALD